MDPAHNTTIKKASSKWLPLVVLLLLASCTIQAQTSLTSGIAILDIGNKRDIYDQRNRDALLKLKQEAVIDAIEKVAAISISVRSELSVNEQESGGQSAFSEQFVNNVLQRYNVKWTRTGNYEFKRDPERKRVWICTVSGKVEIGEAFVTDPTELATQPFVRAKQGKWLYCTDGSNYDLKVGDRIEVIKQRSVNAGSGSILTDKVVGRALVTGTQDRSATAQIISGRYGIKDGYLVRPAQFSLVSGGLKVGFFMADKRVTIKGSETEQLREISGISLEYYELSLTKHYGILFGIDLISDNMADTLSPTSGILRMGVSRPVAILPEFFYLTPAISFGYAVLNEQYELSESGKFALILQMEAGLRLGIVEFGAGVRYNYIAGFEPLSNVFPSVSLSIDFLRYAENAKDRKAPGFGMLMKMLD